MSPGRLGMRSLGTIKSLTRMGYIVVSMLRRKPLPLGLKVYYRDEFGSYRELGVIADVIGNVERPYAVVKVTDKDALSTLSEGSELLYEPAPARKGRRGASRRGRGHARG